jgi:hypothetical protein
MSARLVPENPSPRTFWCKVRTWWRRPLPERLWFGPAFLLLGVARAILLTVPFRHIAPWLGQNREASAVVPLASVAEIADAAHIGRAIGTAARYTPWESKCLAQAMVARLLLGALDLPYALFLGVNKRADAGLTAHAWVCIGPLAVTGGSGFDTYTPITTFISPWLES